MRKVKFPLELDAFELLSEDLRAKMKNVNGRLKEIQNDRGERAKVAKRTKKDKNEDESWPDEEEKKRRQGEAEELEKLVHPSLKDDVGSCTTGLYDLIGIVTHKGASAE